MYYTITPINNSTVFLDKKIDYLLISILILRIQIMSALFIQNFIYELDF